jgi:hypothetical protein
VRCIVSSYQVPKEVGRVGTESPTFIEPIANRKDGIQAMFSRQKQAHTSPANDTSQKRKRDTSPSASRTIKASDAEQSGVPSPKKSKGKQGEDHVIPFDHPPSPTPKTRVRFSSANATLLRLTAIRRAYVTSHGHQA